jgi:hypothetical protein
MNYLLLLLGLLFSTMVSANWETPLRETWEKTKDISDDTYEAMRDAGQAAWDVTKKLFTESEDDQAQAHLDRQDQAFRRIFANTLASLEDGIEIMQGMEHAPESSFFRKDKASYQEDFNDLLDDMTAIFEEDEVIRSRERIYTLQKAIAETEREILRLREQRLAAPRKGRLSTTKQDYDEQIDELRQRLSDQRQEIETITDNFVEKLAKLGIELTPREADLLLTRVDSRDIVQMAVVFNTAKKIDTQLMKLMRESEEDIQHAKRYYGMHVVLLELVRHMHDQYIADINEQYLPKLQTIIGNAKDLYQRAKEAFEEETDVDRKQGYTANMRANQLTVDTAELYIVLLEQQRAKVADARRTINSDLRLARNTYQTVRYSAQLLAILQTTQRSFDALMELQVPELVPFTSSRVQREFEALSRRITASG